MAEARGMALRKLKEAQDAAEAAERVRLQSLTLPALVELANVQAEANRRTLAALWAVFEFVDAAELEGG